jgi:predicted dehydrogenase
LIAKYRESTPEFRSGVAPSNEPKKTMQTLSIGIVGAGAVTRKSHLPALMNTPNVAVTWIHDVRGEAAKALAGAYGVDAVSSASPAQLPACDVALLAIPVDARGEYLRHFAARGTAVLCEKPFAMNAADHAKVLADFAPHALGAGFMRRMFRYAMLLRRIVQHGMFGQLRRIEISEGSRSKGSGADASFLDDPRLGASRGVLTDLGSHSVDLALHVSGATGFDVQSCTRVMDGAVDRKVTAQLRLQGVATGPVDLYYTISWLDPQDNKIQLTFDRATVWSSLAPSSEVYAGDPAHPRDAISLACGTAGATTYNQAFFLEWSHFLDGIRSRRESLVSAHSALLTTTLVEALLISDVRV